MTRDYWVSIVTGVIVGMVMAQTGGVVLTALTTFTAAMVTAALLKQVT